MTNTVTIRLFAGLAELAGVRQTTVDLGEGLTAGDVYAVLATRHPGIAGYAGSVMFARNQEYVPAETPLAPGDELALIPPVSGGAPRHHPRGRPEGRPYVREGEGGPCSR